MVWPKQTKDHLGIDHGYRSGLEVTVAGQLDNLGVPYTYEKQKIKYVKPQTGHTYTPDFYFAAKGLYVETKGRFLLPDRQKHLLIKKQHPELDIRFVFTRSATTIGKQSKTTYAMWCEKNGFKYADKTIPPDWLL